MSKEKTKTLYEVIERRAVHPFPARMAPDIVLDVFEGEKKSLRVLDPMMGSGTVLAVARSLGHRAIGVDMDPLAVLIAGVWVTAIDTEKLVGKAHAVLARAKKACESFLDEDCYPSRADDETKKFVDYWFDRKARAQLTALSVTISRVHDRNIKNALWCAFSKLIISKQSGASRAMDLSHSRPHRAFKVGPIEPFSKFIVSTENVAANCIEIRQKNRGPAATVCRGDARGLSVKSGSVDLVLTSPPYLNAIDYIRCSKFSLVWMGYKVSELRSVRSESVGAERIMQTSEVSMEVESIVAASRLQSKLSDKDLAMFRRFVRDMYAAVLEASRVVKSGGRAVYVIGENTIRGVFVPNAEVLKYAADNVGFRLENMRSRKLPDHKRYMPPPMNGKASMDARMRKEVILEFRRV